MKKITLIALMLFTALGYAQVGINTNNPDASSALEIESTTGGILIPRLTQTQRDAIVSPASGLMIYQTDEVSGFYFYDGTAWAKIDGVAGPAGPQGNQGAPGPAGVDGQDGVDGAQGVQGDQGIQGETGTQGPIGPTGSIGAAGAPGAQGPIGPTGAQGNQGVQGPVGADSTVLGPVGPVGPVGQAGPIGPTGAQGNQGAPGPAGADGADGAQGPIGPAGAQGVQGPVGQAGPIGPAGAQGNQGAQGLAGPIGPTGNQGAQGPAGADSTVSGPVGQVGPTGAQGQIGPAGADADTSEIAALSDIINNGQVAQPLSIGDFVGGGFVFWIDPTDNTKGLVSAIEDQSTGIRWYNGTHITTGATGTAIGTGAVNTTAIINAQGETETSYAAGLARAYNGGGYTDWFFPSKDELNEMYIKKPTLDAISGFTPFSATVYWTSSEVANNRAWKQNFNNGGQVNDNAKHSSSAVRAIRAVSGTTTSSLSAITAEQTTQNTAIDLKANIASPTFTGTVTTPTLIASGNTYPNTTGNANQVLTTDGSGTLSWTTSSAETINGTVNEIEVSTSDSTTTVGLPDNTTITTSLTVDGLYFGTGSGDGDNNLAIGSSMGSGTGKRNTAIGSRALESYSGTGFDNNTAIGYYNMRALSTGSGNTALGAENMFSLTTGIANTSIGNQTMLNVSTGSNNTGLGQRAGESITTGTNNTLIGLDANVSSPNANNETVIGKGAIGSGDNTVQLGNTSVTNVKTSGSITAGEITIPNTDGTSGQVLTTDGSGALSWTTSSAGVSGSGTGNMIAKFDGSSTVLGNSSIYDDGTNVGIGTVSPAQLLHVKAALGDAKALINAYGEGDEAHLMLRAGGINKTAIVASGISNWGRTDLRFILNSYTNANDYGLSDTKMIIKNDGKVGIGTNSPTEKLDVAGNIKFNGALMPNNNAGSSGQVLTSSGTGVPTWTTPSSGSDSVYSVNTFYAELGGFVIEVRDGGKHGLVVAMQDQGVSTWYPIDNLLNDITRHDTNGAKFMDWRLPTIRELELIYLAKANISPMWGGNDYWSSTQPGYGNAYFVNMANGFGTSSNSPGANHSTNNSKAVRAVRAF
ncbi:conserved hypothetical protein (DUF1566) [Formosa sp. Hel1_33_131]|uniref:Lcl domain-containing protein n=1 Tax=Formosa sp. Hel1_33_131 TaxID=1336794 RepID=UPI00084E33C4|nr:DUF1566 domain-containing protein [Formosa sp. Hel1_33_131]AOR27335.1 conserved hypothetical protein (DUF1566) [Formosa sp. Hel1_33_131]